MYSIMDLNLPNLLDKYPVTLMIDNIMMIPVITVILLGMAVAKHQLVGRATPIDCGRVV